jgi:hypothetical protein
MMRGTYSDDIRRQERRYVLNVNDYDIEAEKLHELNMAH